MVQANSAAPYYTTIAYTWAITNFDSYVNYTLATTNGSASLAGSTITYTPASTGAGGYTINGRPINLTISQITNWINTLSTTTDLTGYSVASDTNGNSYVTGYYYSGSGLNYDFLIYKYNSAGAVQWQCQVGAAVGFDYGLAIAVDSNSNVFIGGQTRISGNSDIEVIKLNTGGGLQWQRYLFGGTEECTGIGVDSSGNVYGSGYSNASGTYSLQIFKYNNTGTIQWQRRLTGLSAYYGNGCCVDASGNLYVAGYGGGTNDAIFVKYDTTGAIQWQRNLTTASSEVGNACAVSTSGDSYIVGYTNTGGPEQAFVAKYNASGTIQWQRFLTVTPNNMRATGAAIDASGNIYVVGFATITVNGIHIQKYNSSGVIQWQRRLSRTAAITTVSNCVSVDNLGNVIVTAYTSIGGISVAFTAKLPDDGSKTGTYTLQGQTFTYAAATATDNAGSLVDSALTLTDAASSLTDAASTLTQTTTTFTSNSTPL